MHFKIAFLEDIGGRWVGLWVIMSESCSSGMDSDSRRDGEASTGKRRSYLNEA